MASSISYTPEPYEQAYYGGLFRAADVEGTGNIGGAQAVQFFARSKLPIEVLKNIWTVADQPSTSTLNPPKFAVALRLIQLTQNGQKGQGATLAPPPGVMLRPVFFEGVSGVTVPMPGPPPGPGGPPPQQQQQQRGMAPPPNTMGPGGRGGGPLPSQMQPPQQQQQHQMMQQPPHSPQRQMRPPTSPGMPPTQQQYQQHPPMVPAGPATPSRALVGPDPYGMTPQERARYEALFPQYAKPDGFVYGQEAVALFTKSGVDQMALRDIWNMVDRNPVDNRLDKLEFAMAMHLIVCVSKKNLPLPLNKALPNSLLALKAASSAPPPATMMNGTGSAPGSPMHSPQQQQQQQPPPQLHQPQFQQQQSPPQPTSHYVVETVDETPVQGGPRTMGAVGGMSISDAFDGLESHPPIAPTTTYQHHPPTVESRSLPSYVPEPSSPQPSYVHRPTTPPSAVPAPAPAMSIPATSSAAASYNLGDEHAELGKLKVVLQKLQAENISLKAQLGNMSEEEKEVHKELGATVAAISKLSTELSGLRQEVLDAKSRLLETSAELKAQNENKGILTDLIGEAKETRNVIQEATHSIQNVHNHPVQHVEAKTNDAMKRSDNFEESLFGYEDSAVAPATTTGAFDSDHIGMGSGGGAPTRGTSLPPPSTYSESAYGEDSMGQSASRTNPSLAPSDHSSMYYNYGGALPQGPDSLSNDPPKPHSLPPPKASPHPTPIMDRPVAVAASPHPTPIMDRPVTVANQNRQTSGFDSGFVMGGSAPPVAAPSSAARSHSSSGDYGYEDEESFQVVEDMKKKAERAAETARDAEAAHRKLANEADELRTDSDKADATARSLRAAAEEKKKGRFGNAKKKTMERDAERAAQDAVEIRKRFIAVQGQAHDAETVAVQTRREADRLKDEAEKAEIDMVAAASLREQQKSSSRPAPTPAPAPSNGYGGTEYGGGYNKAPPPSGDYGYGQIPPPDQVYGGGGYGYGQPVNGGVAPYGGGPSFPNPSSTDGGFAAGVMGNGANAYDLPSPAQLGPPTGGDGYHNPY